MNDHLPVPAWRRGHPDTPVNGHWQHVAVIVVGVLSNEIHPPRRSYDSNRFLTEYLRKLLSDIRRFTLDV